MIITELKDEPEVCAQLGVMMAEAVAHGGSLHFMYPLDLERATAFWRKSLAAAARGERIVFGAWEGPLLIGTVTLILDLPPNQPHRAEIGKMMTRVSHRGRGVATALLRAAEARAVSLGRTLLVLDTAQEGGASGMYEKLGFTLAGTIPDYALLPHGGLTPAMFYWKRVGEPKA
jgi:ribosomal protein S18 acetylase RimI-like enzyme